MATMRINGNINYYITSTTGVAIHATTLLISWSFVY